MMNGVAQTPKEFRIWENPDSWMSVDLARRFVSDEILDQLPYYGAMICHIDCGEIADCTLANDFRGGILMWYTADVYSKWRWIRFANEDEAFQARLNSPWI